MAENFMSFKRQGSCWLVCGLGITGESVVRFIRRTYPQDSVLLWDSRSHLSSPSWAVDDHRVTLALGQWPPDWLTIVDQVVISPGVDPKQTWFQSLAQQGVPMTGDVGLFALHWPGQLIGITGTNGKSTVTQMTADVLQSQGLTAMIGGNFGIPACDLLLEQITEPDKAIAVLELSSFQLETSPALPLQAGILLNISEDHLERHQDMADYVQQKLHVFRHCAHKVVGKSVLDSPWGEMVRAALSLQADEAELHVFAAREWPFADDGVAALASQRWFGQSMDDQWQVCHQHGVSRHDIGAWLLSSVWRYHDQLNRVATLALVQPWVSDWAAAVQSLAHFVGLDHRQQPVTNLSVWAQGVSWIDDSKGTNVGATQAAIRSLPSEVAGRVHLLLGGVSKGQHFLPLQELVKQRVDVCWCYGEDGALIAAQLPVLDCRLQATLASTMARLKTEVKAGDVVLLSPACASFDEFANYVARGQFFQQFVQGEEGG